jgi:hypothetical protein
VEGAEFQDKRARFCALEQHLTSIGGDQCDPACRIACEDNPASGGPKKPGEKYGLAQHNHP